MPGPAILQPNAAHDAVLERVASPELANPEPAHIMHMCSIYRLTHNTVVNVAASLRTTLS